MARRSRRRRASSVKKKKSSPDDSPPPVNTATPGRPSGSGPRLSINEELAKSDEYFASLFMSPRALREQGDLVAKLARLATPSPPPPEGQRTALPKTCPRPPPALPKRARKEKPKPAPAAPAANPYSAAVSSWTFKHTAGPIVFSTLWVVVWCACVQMLAMPPVVVCVFTYLMCRVIHYGRNYPHLSVQLSVTDASSATLIAPSNADDVVPSSPAGPAGPGVHASPSDALREDPCWDRAPATPSSPKPTPLVLMWELSAWVQGLLAMRSGWCPLWPCSDEELSSVWLDVAVLSAVWVGNVARMPWSLRWLWGNLLVCAFVIALLDHSYANFPFCEFGLEAPPVPLALPADVPTRFLRLVSYALDNQSLLLLILALFPGSWTRVKAWGSAAQRVFMWASAACMAVFCGYSAYCLYVAAIHS